MASGEAGRNETEGMLPLREHSHRLPLTRSPHGIQERPCASAESAEPSEASPLDKEQQIALLAKKVVASVMNVFEKSCEPGTPSACEPRPEGSQKEQPLARRASQVGKPIEKKPRKRNL